jgi:hypothetical protein
MDLFALATVPTGPDEAKGTATYKLLRATGQPPEEQWRFAVAKGCTLGQGFHLGRPQPAEDLTPRLTPGSQVRA